MITKIHLSQFRSHHQVSFDIDPKLTIITGPNGSGKTNLLEAIYLIAKGDSFRVSDRNLIEDSKDWLRAEAHLVDLSTRVVKIEMKPGANLPTKKFEINGKTSARLKSQDVLPVVLFEPEDMRLLTGEPELRRRLIDRMIENTSPTYIETLKHYKRALLQRNRLLKTEGIVPEDQFFVWHVRLSELGAKIIQARQDLIAKLNTNSSDVYSNISGKPESLKLEYQTKFSSQNLASEILNKLTQNLDRDKLIGFTTSGPHRDDITFALNDHPSSTTASRGETRSILISLKKLEADLTTNTLGHGPIVLFDDIYGELDNIRQSNLLSLLPGCQVIITSVSRSKLLPGQSSTEIKFAQNVI